ncbi:MAG TPA: hypothetical protein DCS93_43535 [Microscillaceae bacterium]|nr:hypothetical protein [Microscillaceae bacterium]
MGKDYYFQIHENPLKATNDKFSWYVTGDISCYDLCFIASSIFSDTYNESLPETSISRESYSNQNGWPEGF